jgi:hypothetical protein
MTNDCNELVYWRDLPDGACALHFSEAGWAMAGACAEVMVANDVQELMFSLIGQVVTKHMRRDPEPDARLWFDWLTDKDASTGILGFLHDTLPVLSEVCNVPAIELQTTIQLSVGQSLSIAYRKMATRRH